MQTIAVWGFKWIPPFAQGLVRDLRVRWALEEAGLAYESRWIEIDNLKSDAYRSRHPFGLVPVLECDGGTLIESGAIVHAIAEQCETLMPADRRNETLTWMFTALNTIEPPVWNLFTMDVLHRDEAWVPLRRPGAVDDVKTRLSALSRHLADRDYLLGDFTAADILMTTVLRFIRHTDLVAQYARLDAYVKRCEARPAFEAALRNQMNGYSVNEPVTA